ncbi:MAG TPA: dolichyl-phosphate beta-glucosyltransferase [Thermomicrobiales bacterium]|nr:dolichyl-phosphate beta-glucosyltransferase [Thermomicrobiales bacterium]
MESTTTPSSGTPSLPGVSIVIPVYNESERIGSTLEQLAEFLRAAPFRAEVIIADDGSTDDTRGIAARHAGSYPHFHLLTLPHGGKARAVLAGLRVATQPIVGFMDADLATPLPTLVEAVELIQGGADVAIGSREGEGSRRIGEPEYRHIMGRLFNRLVRLLILPGIHDTQCGFKFMTSEAATEILSRVQLYRNSEEVSHPRVTAFDVELLFIARQLGLAIAVIPVTWSYGTSSKVSPLRDTLQNLRDVVQVWLNGRRGLYAGDATPLAGRCDETANS